MKLKIFIIILIILFLEIFFLINFSSRQEIVLPIPKTDVVPASSFTPVDRTLLQELCNTTKRGTKCDLT